MKLGAWTELKRWDKFGGRVTGDPHPQVVRLVAQGGEEFVQLEMAEGQVPEKVGMNLLGVFARAGEPRTNRYLGMLEEQAGIGDRQSQVDGQEDLSDLRGGSAEAIQRRAASTGKALAARLAFQPLDAVRAALAVTDERVKGRIRVAEVVALRPWASVPGRADGLGLAAGALAFPPRQDARLAHVAGERRGMWATADWAIVGRAWLEGARRFALG
jgi:hypothetical protein